MLTIIHLDIFGMTLSVVAFLIAGSILAGFVDSICGGGGLISIPVLMLAGLSPAQAIAANKLQGTFGAVASTHYYFKKKTVKWEVIKKVYLGAIMGGTLGTLSVNYLGNDILEKTLPLILIAMAIYFFFSQNVSDVSRKAKVTLPLIGSFIVPIISFYDGFFGPGAGSFYMIALISLAGMNTIQAIAYSRTLNLISNFTSMLIFIYLGKMIWIAGITVSIGEVIGVYLGSNLAQKKGTKLVKPLLVMSCVAMAITSFYRSI